MLRRSVGALGALSGLLLGAAGPVPDDRTETIEHVVQPGETLWSIAAQESVLGDANLWPVIYKFNRDQIKDPGRIYPRQRLQIPVAEAQAQPPAAPDKAQESE